MSLAGIVKGTVRPSCAPLNGPPLRAKGWFQLKSVTQNRFMSLQIDGSRYPDELHGIQEQPSTAAAFSAGSYGITR
jgi:hypothetical protein